MPAQAIMQTITLPDEAATARLAAALAGQLQAPSALLLRGDLGAGKTTLARLLIRTLAGDPALDVPSPTFTLVQGYDTARGPVMHYDLYRLQRPEEVEELGWDEALADSIVIVEWPERLGRYAPKAAKTIHLKISDHGRTAELDGFAHVA